MPADNKVTVTFKLQLAGGRTFPLPSKRRYRFDLGSNRVQTIPLEDARALFERYGLRAFDFNPPLKEVSRG